jgi:hypothetical protein
MSSNGNQRLDPYNVNRSNLTALTPINGSCYFHKKESGRMIQYISKTHYSLLINEGIAYVNISAFMGCAIPNRKGDKVLVDVRCFNYHHEGPFCGRLGIRYTTFFYSFLF